MVQVKDISDDEILDCIRARLRGEIRDMPPAHLAAKYPPKVVERKMEKMIDRGILEYGVSVHSAWIVGDPLPTPSQQASAFAVRNMTPDQVRELAGKVKTDGGRCVLQLPNAVSLDITDIVLAAAERLAPATCPSCESS